LGLLDAGDTSARSHRTAQGESLLQTLTAEVRQMRHDLNLLIEKSPDSISTWIPPRELARLLGVSSQTITAYRNDGRFRSSSTRAIKRGQRTDWEYHRQDAVADVRGLL
jgi:transcriptional regulator with XRE-family HTH domain